MAGIRRDSELGRKMAEMRREQRKKAETSFDELFDMLEDAAGEAAIAAEKFLKQVFLFSFLGGAVGAAAVLGLYLLFS